MRLVPGASLPPRVAATEEILRALPIPWAIAGGWAIDLALGRVTRPHADVDVAIYRADQAALRAALGEWSFDAIVARARVPWAAGAWLAPPVHEVHALPPSPDGGGLEFLLNERDGADWVYRRDPAVRLPLARAIRPTPAGVPVLAPEIVLLYKSKAPRASDEHDFTVGLELLDAESRAWLWAAIHRQDPHHPWAERLEMRPSPSISSCTSSSG